MKIFSVLMVVTSLLIAGCNGINHGIPRDDPPAASAVVPSDVQYVAKSVAKHSRKGHLTLSWDPVAGASWYNLYYGTKPGVTKSSPMKVTKIRTTRHTVTGLSPGAVYFFVVTAANKNTESPESCEVSGKPKQ